MASARLPEFKVVRPLGRTPVARDVDAQRREVEVLAILTAAADRAHKALTIHTRQFLELQLKGERGWRLASLFYFLSGVDQATRDAVADLVRTCGEAREHKAVLIEVAEATEAAGVALSWAQRLIAGRSWSPRDLVELAQRVAIANREFGDVPAALIEGGGGA